MTAARRSRPWRKALMLGAVLAVAAGVVIGTWLRPAATTQLPPVPQVAATGSAVTVARPEAQLQTAPGEATFQTNAQTISQPASEPGPNTDATPIVLALPADATELSQLRERGLMLPVRGVAAAQLTDTYTQARAAGAQHEALDIMAPRGTPVLAVEDGPVAKLFLSKPGGITLYQFDPAGQYAYYYAHLDSYADGVVEGAQLRKGQVIAYVGSTGNASPDAPHLHFAIFKLGPEKQWWRGTPLNPFPLWRETRP